MNRKTSNHILQKCTPYLMILPTLVLLAIFALYPVALSIIKSLFRWSGGFGDGVGINQFIWFDNYLTLFQDPVFWQSWGNSLFFMITGVIVNLVFPFLCGLMIFSIKNGASAYRWRVAFVIPMVVPSMVIFLLWQFIYDYDSMGVINNILQLLNLPKVNFLGEPHVVKWAIRFMGFPWVGGTFLLVYLAGLSNVDNSLREAATIDGAGLLKKIFFIDIPLCKSQFKMVFTLSIIGEIQDFVKIQTLTGGGPGYYSYVPGLYMYNLAFNSSEYGLASALGVIMMVVMLLFSFLSNLIFRGEAND